MILLKTLCVFLIAFYYCDARDLMDQQGNNKDLQVSLEAQKLEDADVNDVENELLDIMDRVADKWNYKEGKRRVYNGYTYIFHRDWLNYYHAERFCHAHDAEVAWETMKTVAERKAVYELFGGYKKISAWIGARYFAGGFRYPNCEKIKSTQFGWSPSEPNYRDSESCTANWRSLHIFNIACTKRFSVICEKKN